MCYTNSGLWGHVFQLTRLLRGVTTGSMSLNLQFCKFQLTRLLRGVTQYSRTTPTAYRISTHTPLARRDTACSIAYSHGNIFQLTRLLRGVTMHCGKLSDQIEFQLTRLLRGVTAFRGCFGSLFHFNSHASCEA